MVGPPFANSEAKHRDEHCARLCDPSSGWTRAVGDGNDVDNDRYESSRKDGREYKHDFKTIIWKY